ncbi:hypothetical protein JXD38_07340 [candidate division WOR-3 bacterium]|nr:hypothetical protein [candidate division WOR-3 bacterium]
MNGRDYEPKQALELLLGKIKNVDEGLHDLVKAAVDAGKDIYEEDEVKGSRKKPRRYRKAVPLSPPEALQIAVRVLESHFVEQSLCANSIQKSFARSSLGYLNPEVRYNPDTAWIEEGGMGDAKRVEIELQTETQVVELAEKTHQLAQVADNLIAEQRSNVTRLRELVTFDTGVRDGHAR